jgi:hypothetical protein
VTNENNPAQVWPYAIPFLSVERISLRDSIQSSARQTWPRLPGPTNLGRHQEWSARPPIRALPGMAVCNRAQRWRMDTNKEAKHKHIQKHKQGSKPAKRPTPTLTHKRIQKTHDPTSSAASACALSQRRFHILTHMHTYVRVHLQACRRSGRHVDEKAKMTKNETGPPEGTRGLEREGLSRRQG